MVGDGGPLSGAEFARGVRPSTSMAGSYSSIATLAILLIVGFSRSRQVFEKVNAMALHWLNTPSPQAYS